MDSSVEDDTRIDLPNVPLYLKTNPLKGRGVCATNDIAARTLINISPVLLFPSKFSSYNKCSSNISSISSEPSTDSNSNSNFAISNEREILNSYTYTWDSNTQALALGLGSMFNHSSNTYQCNVAFQMNKSQCTISYTTTRAIKANEELCINYGPKLWFVDVEGYGRDSDSEPESVDEECIFGNMYQKS